MRTIGRGVLACLAAFLILSASCQPGFVEDSVTLIEIRDLSTMDPLVGAAVSATVTIRFDEEVVKAVAPTTALGRTYVPLLRVDDFPFDGVLTVGVIGDNEQMETLRVTNRNGSLTSGELFSVRIVDTGAALPPPLITALLGSNPATVKAVGYIGSIGVCSNAMDSVLWAIAQPGNASEVYKDLTVEVGTVPDGYVDRTESPFLQEGCPVLTQNRNPEGFMPYVRTNGGIVVVTNDYCVSDDGSVIECP